MVEHHHQPLSNGQLPTVITHDLPSLLIDHDQHSSSTLKHGYIINRYPQLSSTILNYPTTLTILKHGYIINLIILGSH